MNPLYEKLLTGYAAPLLKDIGHFYNGEEISPNWNSSPLARTPAATWRS